MNFRGLGCWWTPAWSALPTLPLLLLPAALAQGPYLHPEAWYLLLNKMAPIKKRKDPKQGGLLPSKQRQISPHRSRPLCFGGLDSYQYLLRPSYLWGWRGGDGPQTPLWLLGTWPLP